MNIICTERWGTHNRSMPDPN